jgi:hypothetical protein
MDANGNEPQALECADLSALSAGDLSPSRANGASGYSTSRWTRRCLADKSAKRRKR